MAAFELEYSAKERDALGKRWGVTGQTVYLWMKDLPVAGKRRMFDLAVRGMTVAPNRTPVDLREECEKRGMFLYDFYEVMAASAQVKVKCDDPRRVSLIHDVLRGLDLESES